MSTKGLRTRLEALKNDIERDRDADVQWYRSMTVYNWICDVLEPPENKDSRAVPEVPESPQRARDRRTKHADR